MSNLTQDFQLMSSFVITFQSQTPCLSQRPSLSDSVKSFLPDKILKTIVRNYFPDRFQISIALFNCRVANGQQTDYLIILRKIY